MIELIFSKLDIIIENAIAFSPAKRDRFIPNDSFVYWLWIKRRSDRLSPYPYN
jgi:hypothetical protein